MLFRSNEEAQLSVAELRELEVGEQEALAFQAAQAVREEAASVLTTLAEQPAGRAIRFLDLLIGMLPQAVAAPRCANEFFELLRHLMAPESRRLYLAAKGLLGELCATPIFARWYETAPARDLAIAALATGTIGSVLYAVAVNDVDITLRFPDPIKDDDVIEVRGPLGYNLVGDADTNACNDFRYPGNNNPFPTTGFPSCVCTPSRLPQLDCVISWRVRENRDPAYPQNEDIRFKIATINPIQTPLLMDNFWKTVHYRGNVVRSSHVARSWNINPQLDPGDRKSVV